MGILDKIRKKREEQKEQESVPTLDEDTEETTVEVMALGKSPKKVKVKKNQTVGDVLNLAGINSNRVMADGNSIRLEDSIGNTKVLNAIPKVKGGIGDKTLLPPLFFGSDYPYNVHICEKAYLKMYYYTMLHDLELGGLLKVKYDGEEWLIEDVVLLPQKVTGVHFELDENAVIKFVLGIPKEELEDWKGWWHSHVDMEAFWSGEDLSTFNHLSGIMGDMIGIVLNRRRNFQLRIVKDSQTYNAVFKIIPDDLDLSRYRDDINKNVKRGGILSDIFQSIFSKK